jgi:hypothetical protein
MPVSFAYRDRRCEGHGREDEQQLVQIPLSKPIIPPTDCRVPDHSLRYYEIKFQAVGKWTESTP